MSHSLLIRRFAINFHLHKLTSASFGGVPVSGLPVPVSGIPIPVSGSQFLCRGSRYLCWGSQFLCQDPSSCVGDPSSCVGIPVPVPGIPVPVSGLPVPVLGTGAERSDRTRPVAVAGAPSHSVFVRTALVKPWERPSARRQTVTERGESLRTATGRSPGAIDSHPAVPWSIDGREMTAGIRIVLTYLLTLTYR